MIAACATSRAVRCGLGLARKGHYRPHQGDTANTQKNRLGDVLEHLIADGGRATISVPNQVARGTLKLTVVDRIDVRVVHPHTSNHNRHQDNQRRKWFGKHGVQTTTSMMPRNTERGPYASVR